MKKLVFAILAVAVLSVALVGTASAAPIIPYGTFGYVPTSGSTTFAGGSLGSATSVTVPTAESINNTPATYLGNPSIFATFGGAAVTVSPLTLTVQNINGASFTYNITDYLTWTGAGDTFTFNLVSGTWTSSASGNLSFEGLGVFNDSNGTYTPNSASDISLSFTQSAPGSAVNYSATFEVPPASTTTPEPSSLMLLGSGLLASAFLLFRRNRTVRSGSAA